MNGYTMERFEMYEADYEAMMAYLLEEEEKEQMDADYKACGGHLWD